VPDGTGWPASDRPVRTELGGLSGACRRYRYLALTFVLGLFGGVIASVLLHVTVAAVPLLAVAFPFLYVSLVEPSVSLCLFIVVAWSNISGVVGSHGGLSLYLLALAVGAISLALAIRKRDRSIFPKSFIYLLLALVAATEGLSILATPYDVPSLAAPTLDLKAIVSFFVVLGLLQITRRWLLAVGALVLTVAALSGLSIIQQYLFHNSTTFGGLEQLSVADVGSATLRHGGPQGDVNFWGRTILQGIAGCLGLLSLARRRGSRRGTALWGVSLAALLVGVYLTQSRGDLLALVVMLLVWLSIVGWRHRRYAVVVPIVAALAYVAVPGISTRLSTLTELTHISSTTTDPSLLGRLQAQEVGLAMFRSNPITGVGAGNFQVVEPQFLSAPGVYDTGTDLAPHDLYLQLVAEQGILGLSTWLLFFGGALVLCLRSMLLAARLSADTEWTTALGALTSLVGWGAASVVLHLSDLTDLLTVIAIVVVVDGHLRARADESGGVPGPAPSPGPIRSALSFRLAALGPGAVGVGVFLLTAAGIGSAAGGLPVRSVSYAATATATVRPRQAPTSGDDAYTWDTVSRQTLVPTLTDVMSNNRFVRQAESELGLSHQQLRDVTVTASADVTSATISIRIETPDSAIPAVLANRTLADGRTFAQSLLSLYEVDQVTGGVTSRVGVLEVLPTAVELSLLLVALFAGIGATRLCRRYVR
jgi:O-antigen ligase